MLDELLIALQDPKYCIGSLLMEQVICKVLSQISMLASKSGVVSEAKRDWQSIVQLADIVSSLGERICMFYSTTRLRQTQWTPEVLARVQYHTNLMWLNQPKWRRFTDQTLYFEEEGVEEAECRSNACPKHFPYLSVCASLLAIFDDMIVAREKAAEDLQEIIVRDHILSEDAYEAMASLHSNYDFSGYDTLLFIYIPSTHFTILHFLYVFRLQNRVSIKEFQFAILLRRLLERKGSLKGFDASLITSLCTLWVRDLRVNAKSDEASELLRALPIFLSGQNTNTTLPLYECFTISDYFSPTTDLVLLKAVLFQTLLLDLSDKVEETMLMLLFDLSSSVRSKAAKGLCRLAAADPKLVSKDLYRQALNAMIRDQAISVREEGVYLMRTYLSLPQDNDVISLIDELRFMIHDEGISVRKAVVAMFRDIMISQPDHPAYHSMAVCLLERMCYPKEEESIREAIALIFHQLWFTPPTEANLAVMKKLMIHSEVSKSPSKNSSGVSQLHIDYTCNQLVSIVGLESRSRTVEKLLRDLIYAKCEGNEANKSAQARKQVVMEYCERIVFCLVERMLSAEADRSTNVDGLQQETDARIPVVATVAVFCEVCPTLVSKHLQCFLPYLKCSQGTFGAEASEIAHYTLKMVEAAAPLHKSKLHQLSEEIIADLSSIVMRQNEVLVYAAFSCLTSLVKHVTEDPRPLLRLIEPCFYMALRISVDVDQPARKPLSPQQSAQLQRCLVILGAACLNYKKYASCLSVISVSTKATKSAKQFVSLNEETAKLSLKSQQRFNFQALTGCCFAVAAFAFSLQDALVNSRAVQALCDIFTGNPRLMIVAQSIDLVSAILDESQGESIHDKFITGLKSMFGSEEVSSEKRWAMEEMQKAGVDVGSRNVVLGPAESDSDTTIAGFIVQQHSGLLSRFLSHSSSNLRLHSLQLLGCLLSQGILCPLDALASLVMLQTDRDEQIRNVSLNLLLTQDERHPSFLENRLKEGIEMSFAFQSNIFGARDVMHVNATGQWLPYFGPIYQACVHSNRKRRQALLQGLVRKISTPTQHVEVTAGNLSSSPSKQFKAPMGDDILQTTDQSCYLSNVLATLPYNFAEEVLFLIYTINRTVPYEIGLLLADLKQLLSSWWSVDEEEVSEAMPPPAMLPPPANPTGRRGNKTAKSPQAQNNALIQSIHAHLASLSAITDISPVLKKALIILGKIRCKESLIRMKAYLKIVYNIFDEKAALFDPNAKASLIQEKISLADNSIMFVAQSGDAADLSTFVQAVSIANEDLLGSRELVIEAMKLCVSEYHRVHSLLTCDPNDFSVNLTQSTAKAPKKATKKITELSKKRKPKRKIAGNEDDEDEEYFSDNSCVSNSSTPSRSSSRASKRAISYVDKLTDDDFM
ncbi:hypothetical protein EON65_05800 [archaeon]|nr:MAG: hypothetical protein EON65_05800 [archaeon]